MVTTSVPFYEASRKELVGNFGKIYDSATNAFVSPPLNGPHDIVIHKDGAIYFSDPSYACWPAEFGTPGHHTPCEQPQAVYRFNANEPFVPNKFGLDSRLQRVFTSNGQPNGLAFSPDWRKLYVADVELDENNQVDFVAGGPIWVFDVAADG